ncbi:MAG: PatB family C-S lyase [Campylobacterota bacterium]|nr:PatB family C-S lyase [Campylobacterota bacterium]
MFQTVANRANSNAEKYQLREKLFGTNDVLPMWVADMDINTPQYVLDALQERMKHKVFGYEMMPESAYAAQIEWVKQRNKYSIEREWMFYSPSVVATINMAIKAFSDIGDEVIIQPPVYAPFQSSIINNDRVVIKNPLQCDENGDYGFDLEDLKSKITCKTKLLILCSPHNPVGRVWSRSELKTLSEICLEHNIKIISDEIHCDLIYAPNVHTPLASLSDAVSDITITMMGPGKTFNLAGLSISTVVVANTNMRERFKAVYKSIHFAEGTVFGHIAFESAYRHGKTWLNDLLLHLSINQRKLEEVLKKHDNLITCKFPQGTYLAWLKCDKMGLTNKQLRHFFTKKARLGLSPGLGFGKEGDGYMRLNFAVSAETIDEAVRRLESALNNFNVRCMSDKN